MKIGFIGCGNMGSAMIGGILRQGIFSKEDIIVSNLTPEGKARSEKNLGVVTTLDNKEVVRSAKTVVLAVKPQFYEEVLDEVHDSLTEEHTIIGIDPQKDLTIDQRIDFGSTAAAFTGDDSTAYTVEFEPSATILEKEGAGHVVASLGEASGYVPYTSYSVKTSYMKENPEIIQKFTNALQKGMDYVQSHTPEEIAEVIAPQFKETDIDTITTIVKRYYDQDTWKENLIFKKDSFELLQDILEDAGELGERAEYEELVQTEYAKNAVKEK